MLNADSKRIQKFWECIAISGPDDCWEWQKYRTPKGYGTTWYKNKTWRSHRLVWTIMFGEIKEGLVVMHNCDNPPCCNPNHLRTGTNKDNILDCVKKNRHVAGERSGSAKLSQRNVDTIRLLASFGHSTSSMAESFRVGARHIRAIVSGERWAT